jgi:signal transduction histidine kinase/ligand-binding sensor domain-containing protein
MQKWSSKNSNIFREGRELMRRFGGLATLALFVIFGPVPFPASAQQVASEYSHERWGREKGFPWGSVTAIAQSADGYLWVGTNRGLVRFDGYDFRMYENGGPNLKIGGVRQLLADSQGNLWILLATTELLRYHDGKFEAGRDEAQFGTTAIGRRQDGTALFSSSSFGPLTYYKGNYGRLAAENSVAGGNNGASLQQDTLSSRLSWATGVMPHRFVQTDSPAASIAETTDGALWLGTREAGLFYLPAGRPLSEGKNLLNQPVNCLLAQENGELWIGTDHGVMRRDGNQLATAGIPKSLRDGKVVAMMRDRDGSSWVALSDKWVRIDRSGAEETFPDEKTEPTALCEDREGDVWIGSRTGLERLRDNTFRTFDLPGESRSAGAIYADGTGRVWFAPLDGGLRWIEEEQTGTMVNDGLERDVIYSLSGRGNDLWIGRQQGGLTHVEYADDALRSKTYKQKDGLAQDSVYAVYEGTDGTVWAGTLNSGVSAYAKHSFRTYANADGLSSNSITAITEGPEHTMWFGTADGLNELAGGQWRIFRPGDGLPSSEVTCLLADSAGTLWIGTKAGLAFLRSRAIEIPAKLPKTLQEETLGIAEDKFGWLWIATTNHVLRVNRDQLRDGSLKESGLREYGVEDGLRGIEGVKRVPSVLADPRGRIWISTNRGVSVVDPKRALRAPPAVIVHIDAISIDGTPIDVGSPATLNEKPRRVMVTFTGISLSAADRVRYKYKLEGVDEKWSELVKERQVTYSNLGSGTYRFVVVAADNEGAWNSGESSFQFRIAPAFWETRWFRVMALAVCALVTFLVYRLRMRAVTRSANLRFEERLAERTRIAQDLHDTLLQGFLSASMQLHVIADQLPADSPTKPSLNRVLDLVGRVIEEGRNAVRGLRATNPDLHDLGKAFSRIRSEFPNEADVAFRVVVEGTPRPLHPIIRDEIYRIGYEALTNAFRHSKAETIEAELEYAADGLRLVVRDAGVGVDPKEPDRKSDRHWGLTGMRERAQKIGASFKILSRVGTGTEVDLWVPGRIAFLPSPGNSKSSWFGRAFGRSETRSISDRRSRE